MKKETSNSIWLVAEFAFATTYSIREPGTSTTFIKACPIPGPGSIRLALMKASLELYGETRTRSEILPKVLDMDI
jgi:hypothetical protein